ncbi:MAG: helix-turn-helix domain-containing protein [Clostridia bacterium]|nr:helix-turn-helix domain-containing protein [Clostridia bacterium]
MENTNLISRAVAYIGRSMGDSDMTIEKVAASAGFSTDYFNRIFRIHTGFNVMEYVRFARLKKAALMLRTTDREILDIALDCGYEAHESFTRAFGRQYGMPPSEYRQAYADTPMKYADAAEDTTAARFSHTFPSLRPVCADEVMDGLLERDARMYGVAAVVMYDYNGTKFFTDGSCAVGVDEFERGRFYADVIAESPEKAAVMAKLLRPVVSEIGFRSRLDADAVQAAMPGLSVTCTAAEYLYDGESPKPPVTLVYKPLTIEDIPEIRHFAAKYGHDWKVCETLTQRDVYHNDPHDLPFGVYAESRLIGLLRTTVYELRGLRLGEIEGVCLLANWRREDVYDEVFRYAMRELYERGYTLFASRSIACEPGDFMPERYGYTKTANVYQIK